MNVRDKMGRCTHALERISLSVLAEIVSLYHHQENL